jgi:hypothetical protein
VTNLYKTYERLKKGEITEAEAAQLYGLTAPEFHLRLTRNGDRLPLILKSLDRVAKGELNTVQLSEILGVTTRQCNVLIKSWNVSRPVKELPDYLVDRTVSKVKWEIRKNFAIEFISGGATLDEASEHAGVTTRQMRRWVSQLLLKHSAKTHVEAFSDLKDLYPAKRRHLADQIEELEGLDGAKQAVLREVVMGEKALREVATERVLNKHAVKGRSNVRGTVPTSSNR